MEAAGVVVAVLFGAFSLPCLLLVLVLAEAGLRLAALALRGGLAWPTRSAFLGYRIARAGDLSYSSPSSWSYSADGGGFQQDEASLPPPAAAAEYLDRLAVALYRRGEGAAAAVDCVFCLSRVDEGEEVRELRCRHVFHRACLDAWLVRPRATCPLCRDRLFPSSPPRACALDDDIDVDVYSHDDDLSSSSSSAAAAVSYPHGGAIWQM